MRHCPPGVTIGIRARVASSNPRRCRTQSVPPEGRNLGAQVLSRAGSGLRDEVERWRRSHMHSRAAGASDLPVLARTLRSWRGRNVTVQGSNRDINDLITQYMYMLNVYDIH